MARYTIKAFTQDGGEYWIHNPEEDVLITGDPWFEIGDNINGSAEFDVYPEHPRYGVVKKLTTDITFYKDGVEKFSGRVLYDDEDFYGVKHVTIEGELGYLCDTVQRPAVYHDISPRDLCQTYIDIHNAQVENRKKFVLGMVTVEDPNDSLYRYSNWETTRESFQDKLVDRMGGHLVIRKEEENRILDYLDDATYYRDATQKIQFGVNLLDYAKNVDATDVITCLIPLGAQQEEVDIEGLVKYLTIEDVNGGVDYVTDDNAVKEYGRIFGIEHWDDVTLPENLKSKAEAYLKTVQYENLVLELSAVDLNLTDEEIDGLWVGDMVHCVIGPHDIDEWYPISKMKIHLMDPSQNTFTLGTEKANATYTGSNRQTTAELTRVIEEIPTKGDILKQALEEARDLINSVVASGYAIHEPNEFIVADDPDYKNQAKYLWRWGMGGLAHYSNGYYGDIDGIAITMDGKINGKMLIANSVIAESIDFGYTEMLESKIAAVGEAANQYTDDTTRTVQETVTDSITNLEHRISISVLSVKEAIVQKNYIQKGETETIALSAWECSSSVAKFSIEEYSNYNCLKIEFTGSGLATFQQAVGTLPAGNYTVQMEAAFPEGQMPSYIRYGWSTVYGTTYFSSSDAGFFQCVKQSYEISESDRTVYGAVYGTSGKVCYVTNIRCLRNFQELLDDISTELSVETGRIAADINSLYYDAVHDYCVNGDFSDYEDALSGWSYSTGGQVKSATYASRKCVAITNGTSAYYIAQKFNNPVEGRVRVKFSAATTSGNTARVRVTVDGVSQTLDSGSVTSSWQSFYFDFEDVRAGSIYVYLYNYTVDCTVYITDVEILGPYWAYNEAQIEVLTDQISSEVKRATEAEGTLKTSITETAESIELEVSRATKAEGELQSSININAENIALSVKKNEFESYLIQYYNSVVVAFNSSSKYVQITAGAISIYDASVTDSKLRSKFNQSGNHFYRDGYYVGFIGTNQWAGNESHKGLSFGLEYQGKYMSWGYKENDGDESYISMLTFSRESSIYDDLGLHTGATLYMHMHALDTPNIQNAAADGYTATDGRTVPIITSITDNGNGSISWTESSITVRSGLIVGVPASSGYV